MNLIKIAVVLTSAIIMSSTVVFAGIKNFTKEYTYQASELDSKSSSRIIALEQAKRLLLEELGVYLTSHTEVINSRLTKDKITSITAGIVSATVLSEKWDGKEFWLKAQISTDPTIVNDAIKAIAHDTKKIDELEASNKKISELTRQLELIKINSAEAGKVVQTKYNQIIDKISAEDMMREYKNTYIDNINATDEHLIDYLTRIIKKDEGLGEAYWYRAIIYMKRKDYIKAKSDFLRQFDTGYFKTYALSKLTNIYFNNKEYNLYIDCMYQLIENAHMFDLSYNDASKTLTDKSYTILLKKYPNNYKLYAVKARAESIKGLRDKKRKEKFLKLCNKSISIKKDQVAAYYLLADFYRQQSYTDIPEVARFVGSSAEPVGGVLEKRI